MKLLYLIMCRNPTHNCTYKVVANLKTYFILFSPIDKIIKFVGKGSMKHKSTNDIGHRQFPQNITFYNEFYFIINRLF